MISNVQELDKIIGNMLVKQSELDRKRVINGHSIRGVDLSKFVTENVKMSYNMNDSVIIFTIEPLNNDDINFTEEENEEIRESIYMEVKIIIYGSQSEFLAKKLKARFESEKVRYDLLNEDVYLTQINNVVSVNEFVNNSIWHRADFSFNITYEIMIQQIDKMAEMTETNDENGINDIYSI